MSEFVQCLLILAIFLAFIFAIFCGYEIRMRDDENDIIVKKDDNNKKE
jgi:hypothetical protein